MACGTRAWFGVPSVIHPASGLVATASTGRVATSRRALRFVVPVRIELHDQGISLESLVGDPAALRVGTVVALEVGIMGMGSRRDWTVEICGELCSGERRHDVETIDEIVRFRLSAELLAGLCARAAVCGVEELGRAEEPKAPPRD